MSADANLGPRERELLALYAVGFTRTQAATRMGLKEDTVRVMFRRIKKKYAAAGRPTYTKIDLRNRAIEDHLIDSRDQLNHTNDGLLGGRPWTPAHSPTAIKLGIVNT